TVHSQPQRPHAIARTAARHIEAGRTVPVPGGVAGLPSHGGPPVALKQSAYRSLRAAMSKPKPSHDISRSRGPRRGQFVRLVGSAQTSRGHAYWNGSRWVAPAVTWPQPRSLPPLLLPSRPAVSGGLGSASPAAFYASTQVDSATAGCSSPFL